MNKKFYIIIISLICCIVAITGGLIASNIAQNQSTILAKDKGQQHSEQIKTPSSHSRQQFQSTNVYQANASCNNLQKQLSTQSEEKSSQISLANTQSCGSLLVLMYHNVVTTKPNKYAILMCDLEADFQYLKEKACNVVSPQQIKDCISSGSKLPPKAVLITFDDGFFSLKSMVTPLLNKYEYNATFAMVGEYEGFGKNGTRPIGSYSYLDKQDLKELSQEKNVTFANHSFAMHTMKNRKGVVKKPNESYEQYCKTFGDDANKMLAFYKECGITTDIYAYPFGLYCDESNEVLRKNNYSMAFTCNEGINNITTDNKMLMLKRYNISGIEKNARKLIDYYLKCVD